MKKQEFIKELKTMVDNLENDEFHMISLGNGYIFANRNYGEVVIKVAEGVSINVKLYNKEEEEKGGENK